MRLRCGIPLSCLAFGPGTTAEVGHKQTAKPSQRGHAAASPPATFPKIYGERFVNSGIGNLGIQLIPDGACKR